jgi:F420-dependent oxidoreductase-like protein
VVRTAPRHVVQAAVAAASPEASAAPTSLRFGLQVPVFTWPGGPAEIGPRLAAIATAAEEAGFTSLWLMDHLRQIPLFGPPWLDMLESWTTLGFLAAATSTIRLGTMVTPITFRHVGHLAKVVATVDVLSGGRATCGLGLGWFADEHHALGIPFPPVAERYALLEDALELLPLLWGPGTPSYHGRRLQVPEALCYPRPLQARVPIMVGGGGERRTLALVARHADACNIVGEAAVVRRKVAALHRHCAEADRDPSTVEVTQLSTTIVGRDAAEVAGLVERTRPRRTAAEQWAARTNAGTVADQVGRYRELAAAGVGTAIVSLPDLADITAVERFAGVIDTFR